MEENQADPAGITRGQNKVYLLPSDWAAAAQVLAPLVERIDATAGVTQLLILAASAEAAAGIARGWVALRGEGAPRIVAATGAPRAARVLRAGAVPVLVGTPREVLALIRGASLKIGSLRGLAIAWADEILASGAGGDLEAVMAEVPKETPRIIITGAESPDVEGLIDRYAWRAMRARVPESGSGPPIALSYIATAPSGRPSALLQALDELDPPSAAVYVRTDESEREVRQGLMALGYHGPDAPIRALRGGTTEHTALLLLYDMPLDAGELRAAAAGVPARVIAFVAPRQVPHLRGIAGDNPSPLLLKGAREAACTHDEEIRSQLRRELERATPFREILALEPLLVDYDAVHLAAAALALLERERRQLPRPTQPAPQTQPAAHREASQPPRPTRPTPDRPPKNTRPLPRRP